MSTKPWAIHVQGDAQALDRRAQLCLAGEESAAVEELRALAQHQPAVRPLGILGPSAQETLNTFLKQKRGTWPLLVSSDISHQITLTPIIRHTRNIPSTM